MNLLSFTAGSYGFSGYTIGALYSSKVPAGPGQSSSDPRRRRPPHRLSGISPSLVLTDEMDRIENRRFIIRLGSRLSVGDTSSSLRRRASSSPLSTISSIGVGIDVSSRGGPVSLSLVLR